MPNLWVLEMAKMTKLVQSKLMQFGQCVFRVEAHNRELVTTMETMFPPAPPPGNQQVEVVVEDLLELSLAQDKTAQEIESLTITDLLSKLYARHPNCIWISSAAVCAPEGKVVLLLGPSFSGKTTLALAIAITKGWKIISQDITLIDPKSNLLWPCPAPISLRPGAQELLQEFCRLPEVANRPNKWFLEPTLYIAEPVVARFDAVLSLSPFDQSGESTLSDLQVEPISSSEFIREILPWSNVLRHGDAIPVLQAVIQAARCVKLQGGNLSQRVELLKSLV